MTVYVLRNGELVEKATVEPPKFAKSENLSTPSVSRIETFESPVTGKSVSSWRERDRDMHAAGAVDPRDLPRKPFEERKKRNERSRNLTPEWD